MKQLPIGVQHFDKLVQRGMRYVDKTQQVCDLLAVHEAVLLARPRRFGKSLLLSTIAQLFQGKRELFTGLWAEQHWDWQRVHPVLHLSVDRSGQIETNLEQGVWTHLDVLEFKLDQSVEVAIRYLREKGYAERFRHDGRPVQLLGINFSRSLRAVADWQAEAL